MAADPGSSSYAVVPRNGALRDATITADVRRDPSQASWDVTVVITRVPDQAPIDGTEVQARLVDENGASPRQRSAASGPLPEAGGSLGMSATAQFQFQDHGARLTELVVRFRGTEIWFDLSPM